MPLYEIRGPETGAGRKIKGEVPEIEAEKEGSQALTSLTGSWTSQSSVVDVAASATRGGRRGASLKPSPGE